MTESTLMEEMTNLFLKCSAGIVISPVSQVSKIDSVELKCSLLSQAINQRHFLDESYLWWAPPSASHAQIFVAANKIMLSQFITMFLTNQ